MIRGRVPHAVLLVGPAGIGKTTLADDLASGLLCTVDDLQARPCGACRACRLVASGGHPDVHRIGPDGAGRQVVIGGPGSKVRGIRDLIGELALLPVEGGARIAIVESAQRMNEDAQTALLKTLEEPPAGVTLILCADAEEPLLPTIRSRCARIRLGPVGTRVVETILGDHGMADPPLAARLARIAAGRPGVALAWAADPDALQTRDELTRTLLDLSDLGPSDRLAAVRAVAIRATRIAAVVDPPTSALANAGPKVAGPKVAGGGVDDDLLEMARTPATERRRAADALIALWMDVARDVALCQRGLAGDVRELRLLDETTVAAGRLAEPEVTAFLDRLGRAAVLVRSNVSPELILDDLAVHWPRPATAAA
ncbi:MAG: hypothetical protein ABIP77_06795 [Candidatus Limnocylindrales bacterium]